MYPVPPIRGTSVEIAVHQLCNHLSKYEKVVVFSGQSKSLLPKEITRNRKDIRIKYVSKNNYLSQVEKHLKREKPDWIQIENRPLYLLRLKRKWPKKRMILSLHSVTFIDSIKKSIAYHSLKNADIIFVNSNFIKQQLYLRFPHLKTPIFVNYLGVDEESFVSKYTEQGQQIREYMRNKLGLQEKKVLLFVGRIIPLKGLHLLLHGLPSLIEENPNLHLVIVGPGFYRDKPDSKYVKYLKQLIEPIKDSVTVLKYIPPSKIPHIYHIADIVVTPSVEKEAYCLVNVEASASGIPIITTEVGGIPEVVSHGFNGYVIHPKRWNSEFVEYASNLLNNEELNDQIGMNGVRLTQEKLRWSETVKKFHQSYMQIQKRYKLKSIIKK